MTEELDAPGLDEDDDGKAKSDDEVGSGVRDDEALGIWILVACWSLGGAWVALQLPSFVR